MATSTISHDIDLISAPIEEIPSAHRSAKRRTSRATARHNRMPIRPELDHFDGDTPIQDLTESAESGRWLTDEEIEAAALGAGIPTRKELLRRRMLDVRDRLDGWSDQMHLDEVRTQITSTVTTHPGAALLTVAGVGLLLGLAAGRRRGKPVPTFSNSPALSIDPSLMPMPVLPPLPERHQDSSFAPHCWDRGL